MRIGICDDDKIWRNTAEDIVSKYCQEKKLEAEFFLFQNKEELMQSVQGLDLLFMDIELEEDNGIKLIHEVNHLHSDCFVVYLTNYLYYAPDVYETKHDYFVLKNQFSEKIDRVMNLYDKTRKVFHDKFTITTVDKSTCIIPVKQIVYLERSARTTKIVTLNDTYPVKTKLEDLESNLTNYEFIRTHKSFMVNPWYVRESKKTEFILENEQNIPISRRYERSSREDFLRWASSHLI